MNRFVTLAGTFAFVLALGAFASPSVSQAAGPSTNVAYVFDSSYGTGLGGSLDIFQHSIGTPCTFPTCAYTPTGGGPATLTNVPISSIGPGTLTSHVPAYDTVILYQTCKIGTPADAAAMTEINSFLNNGNKVMIFNGDGCSLTGLGQVADYSGTTVGGVPFLFPFTTTDPGPVGAPGPYTFVEANTLTTGLLTQAGCATTPCWGILGDAVGDASVMVTKDPAWCQSIAGTNVHPTTGPIEAYARTSGGGLAIYEGEDFYVNYGPNAHLKLVFDNMLTQTWNPDGLPCTMPLAPPSITICKRTNPAGGTGFNVGWSFPSGRTTPFLLNDGGPCWNASLDPSLGPYSFTELPTTPAWRLVNIVCTGGANIIIGSNTVFDPGDTGVTINLGATEHVTCTFFNATVTIAPVGGITELEVGGSDSARSAVAVDNSGVSAERYAVIVGGVAAALGALVLAGWYTRKRRLDQRRW